MKKYASCGVERVHRVRRVPRSYDMSRTHIVHKSVNRHVDVVLKCAPKNWKKKKVQVTVVKGDKKKKYVEIRVNAKKGYVAVKKSVNHEFDSSRKSAATFDEKRVIRYDKVKTANRGLIHDMKSQVALMAKKSADYIDNQLKAPDVNVQPVADNTAAVSASRPVQQPTVAPQPSVHSSSYRANAYNPYASDYSKHSSNSEFHILMDSLEKSLDEACRKHSIGFVQPEPEKSGFVQSSVSGYPKNDGVSVSVNSSMPSPSWNSNNQSAPSNPVAEEYKPVTMFPKDEEEEYKPITMFPKDEEEEYKPITMFPKDEEEEYKPITMFPEGEEEFTPVSSFPQQNPSETSNFQPQTFVPHQNNYGYTESSGEIQYNGEQERQTFFSRTGDQIKKVIGIIRGKTSKSNGDDYINENVEITYSDDNNDPYGY